MSAPPVVLGFPSDFPPTLAQEIEILASRHALGMRVPAVVILTYDGADGRPTTVVWTPDPADRARALRWAQAGRGER
jgi:hypothetical protein